MIVSLKRKGTGMQKWRILGAAALAAALAGPAAAEEERGLPVGTAAPDFSLLDQNGEERQLGEFTARGQTVLLFYRSADW